LDGPTFSGADSEFAQLSGLAFLAAAAHFFVKPMAEAPDTSEMTRVADLTDKELLALAHRATEFLTKFRWCSRVKESFLAYDMGSMLGVFLFRIEPRLVGVDDTLWVIVGDLPSAFLVCDHAPDWIGALTCYHYEMQRWVEAVRSGGSLDGIIPVDVSPTGEHADMLASRLDFIDDHFIKGKPFENEPEA
jgi:hypothetical protein